MANSKTTKTPANSDEKRLRGTYIAYDADSNEIYRDEDYEIGGTIIPTGVSMSMKAMAIVDPKTGDIIASWDPWSLI